MARLKEIEGATIGLDTVIFIYALEGNPEFGDIATQIFEMIEQGKCQGVASDLVLAELMVKPLRLGQPDVAEEYAQELPNFPNLLFVSLTRKAVIQAAKLRGSSQLGLVDAFHLATAVEAGCTLFLTNDHAMKHPSPGVEILLLSDFEGYQNP